MKVLHIAFSDIAGGAARAAYRLHQGLRSSDIDSNMLVKVKESDDLFVNSFVSPKMNFMKRFSRSRRQKKISQSFIKYESHRPGGLELFCDSRNPFNVSMINQIGEVDIINIHWVSGFIDYQSFFNLLPHGLPVVWTLHDMNTFTGGCHYTGNCRHFEEKCGACPQLGSSSEEDLSRIIWEDKHGSFSVINSASLHVVTPSNWLFDQAGKSSLLGRFSKTVIPYGLDTDIFNNRNSDGLQEALGIPSDAFIIGFVADSLTNKRKGFAYLNNALNQLNNRKIYLVSIGGNSPALPDNLNHIHLGRIEQDRLLSLAFSLFDIFVCPSLEDNLPNTVLESLACGTPVVGFNTGGMPDMVDSGITGYLATDYSVESLRFCIEKALIEKNGLEAMAIDCREKVLNEYTLTKQADSYSKLYSSMLGRAC